MYTNNYCISDGDYQKYNPSGEVIMDQWYREKDCGGDTIIQYSAVPLDTCMQEDLSQSSQYVRNDSNGYEMLRYSTPDCSGNGIVSFDVGAECKDEKPICDGVSSTFEDFNSVYFGPIGGNIDSNGGSSSGEDNLTIGLGVGIGVGILITVCVAFSYLYARHKKASSLLTPINDLK